MNSKQARKKRQLAAKLRRLVNDPRTGSWLFNLAADLLRYRGRSPRDKSAIIIRKQAQQIFRDLREIRESDAHYGSPQEPRGAWFNTRVLAIAKPLRIPTHRTIHP